MGLLQSYLLDEDYLLVSCIIRMNSTKELIQSGKKYLAEGKFIEALDCFDQSLVSDPQNPNLLNLKGVALRSLGRYDEALECYNKSLELDPRDKASS